MNTVQDNTVAEQFARLDALIGETPLLAISMRYRGELRTVYAKAEAFNLSGSIKDRVAYHILKKAYAAGTIRPGDIIAEAAIPASRFRQSVQRWGIPL